MVQTFPIAAHLLSCGHEAFFNGFKHFNFQWDLFNKRSNPVKTSLKSLVTLTFHPVLILCIHSFASVMAQRASLINETARNDRGGHCMIIW